MKPAAFEYERAYTVDEALVLLSQSTNARLLAGGRPSAPCSICDWFSHNF